MTGFWALRGRPLRILPLTALLLVLLMTGSARAASTPVYRCSVNGTVTFADHPCGNDAQKLKLPNNHIGGRFDLNLPPAPPNPEKDQPPKRKPKKSKGCPAGYLNSTELNSLRIDHKVYPGMSKEQVREILGPPDHINKDGQWVYMYQYWVTGRYLFVNGCLKAKQ